MTVTITTTDRHIHVATSYDPSFITLARSLGGRWQSATKTWRFDARDDTAVRDACRSVYGTDGSASTEPTVTVHVTLPGNGNVRVGQHYRLAGIRLAHRHSRDSPVRLGNGVVLVAGGFPHRGGSIRNPDLEPQAGTILQLRDLPRPVAEKMAVEAHGVEIIEEAQPTAADRIQLTAASTF